MESRRNRLLTALAGGRWLMTIFQPPDDAAYLAWLDANPNGYVINAEPGGRGYVLLHRATCTHMRSHPRKIVCGSRASGSERRRRAWNWATLAKKLSVVKSITSARSW